MLAVAVGLLMSLQVMWPLQCALLKAISAESTPASVYSRYGTLYRFLVSNMDPARRRKPNTPISCEGARMTCCVLQTRLAEET